MLYLFLLYIRLQIALLISLKIPIVVIFISFLSQVRMLWVLFDIRRCIISGVTGHLLFVNHVSLNLIRSCFSLNLLIDLINKGEWLSLILLLLEINLIRFAITSAHDLHFILIFFGSPLTWGDHCPHYEVVTALIHNVSHIHARLDALLLVCVIFNKTPHLAGMRCMLPIFKLRWRELLFNRFKQLIIIKRWHIGHGHWINSSCVPL